MKGSSYGGLLFRAKKVSLARNIMGAGSAAPRSVEVDLQTDAALPITVPLLMGMTLMLLVMAMLMLLTTLSTCTL